MTDLADGVLFELWLTAKDGDAFTELARRHAPVVYDIAARALGDRTAAEDVVQEALLDLALEPTRKPIEVGVVAWLVRFAICRARNWRSSESCRTRRQRIVGARRPEEVMPDARIEETEETERALAAAEPDERTVLAMRFLHGWDYDQIAAALETSEGAARVRVHRALANVRARLGTPSDDAKVAGRMAGIALIPLPAAKLDGVIRSVLSAAHVPASPLPSSGVPTALRAAIYAFSAAVLLAGAGVSSLHVNQVRGAAAATSPGELAAVDTSGASAASSQQGGSASLRASWKGVPRPENWDGGALARLARGRTSVVASDTAMAHPPAKPADTSAGAAPAPVVDPHLAAQQPSSAFRPSAGGASAANSDPSSSSDERADALGGSTRTLVLERVADRPAPEAVAVATEVSSATATADAAPQRRVATRGRPIDDFDATEKALLDEAAALVRSTVERAVAEAPDAPSLGRVKRTGARNVERQVRAWRGESAGDRPHSGARKAARLSRVYSILFDLAMSEGVIPGTMRWPGGVDVADALADLIRVLSAAPQGSASRLPGIAEGDAAPELAPQRRPEFE